ncbi:MAG: polyprenyl synthetase family protein [Magnetococcales bacterium]|nr:polyprenyl synthetase family protein [Magnetococcales bacterium]MBF0322903.1 polyprenyl synthetase family protein [Magnetococcales bacterium]
MDLQSYLGRMKAKVDAALESYLPSENRLPQRLHAAMRYSLMAGGKRLRPVLALAAAEAVGGEMDSVMPFACAMECIHTYSLIHDDLPAMDNDDMRRGWPTCHKKFDEATAILAGDALLTFAFELLAQHPVPGQSAEVQLDVMAQLAKAAGMAGMVGGQMLDMEAENRLIDHVELQNIHIHKTGALIRMACVGGARLAGGDTEQIKHLKRYGEAVGLAFQITDDILDEIGDSKLMGKNTGSDRNKSKATYPFLIGLGQARMEAQLLVDEALKSLESFQDAAHPLRDLARFTISRTN